MVKQTSLDFMKRNNDVLEEDNVFFSERHSKSTDNCSKDIE
jgi:hypothetical protein